MDILSARDEPRSASKRIPYEIIIKSYYHFLKNPYFSNNSFIFHWDRTGLLMKDPRDEAIKGIKFGMKRNSGSKGMSPETVF